MSENLNKGTFSEQGAGFFLGAARFVNYRRKSGRHARCRGGSNYGR
jgi:hypothetical protein